ncbi:MAG: endolytic transglycosylase MltG [Flavobacteriaceae bacterium]|nr:endolytic transglycosylase MltG [Bacteroidia bacterium]NNF74805.1 endolytic transglycosylase MltG [Flavobacteriaceae bacterium]
MNIKKIALAAVLVGLVIFAFFAYYVYKAMFVENTVFNNDQACLFIPSDATYQEVRQDLIPLLQNMKTFDALAKRKKYVNNVKAGRYCIKNGMTNNDIINTIRSQNQPIRISFNNQNTIEELAGRVAEQIEADSLSLQEAMTDSIFMSKNGFKSEMALGLYIPNSYEFFWNTDAKGFRDRMLKEFRQFWSGSRQGKADQINLTIDEVMTLASIVHEESKQASEQARIAGVYINRLRSNWPLQADPTLKFAAYQLPEFKNTLIKRVLNVHKEIDSPYNTYKYSGLPPGPIGMPDISAIDAVLNYEEHDYYFFAADPDRPGFHRFARTLSQHARNAREYQQYLNQQGIRR